MWTRDQAECGDLIVARPAHSEMPDLRVSNIWSIA